MFQDVSDELGAFADQAVADFDQGSPGTERFFGLFRRFDVRIGYDRQFIAGIRGDQAHLIDIPGLDTVDAVHEAVIGYFFDFCVGDDLGELDDDRFVDILGHAGVQDGVYDVRTEGGGGREVQYEEVAEVVCEGEGGQVVSVDAGGQDVGLGVFLDPPDGPTDSVRSHGTDLYKAESQVVKVVVKLSVDIQSCAESDRVVEVQAEDLALEADGAVVVDPAADQAPTGDLLDEFEVSKGDLGGALDVHPPGERSDREAI